jgi:hypothetical protein
MPIFDRRFLQQDDGRLAKLRREMTHTPRKTAKWGDVLNALAISSSPIPVAGDIAGIAADAHMYKTDPASRTWGNYGLSALGLLPYIPPAAASVGALGGLMARGGKGSVNAGKFKQAGAIGGKGLPMDQASRMQRAKEMGFASEGYHGSQKDITSLNDDIYWISEEPHLANEYAISNPLSDGGENVTKVNYKSENPVRFRHAEQRKTITDVMSEALEQSTAKPTAELKQKIDFYWDKLTEKFGDGSRSLYEFWYDSPELKEYFESLGFDSIKASEKADMKSKTIGILKPNNVRSTNAAFDPTKKDSANLLASFGVLGLGGLLGGSAIDSKEEELY